ncbi:hypothetical protein C823_007949 [Eubacterium plexicaudatum ASF492]|nr:hypothetical protein C823_007949 [Eubacterium plexicaudatum ASF492]
MRIAHKKDAAACIKFIYWLKKNIRHMEGRDQWCDNNEIDSKASENVTYNITELSAAEKLEKFRCDMEIISDQVLIRLPDMHIIALLYITVQHRNRIFN